MALDRDEGGAGVCLPLWRMSFIAARGVESGCSRLCTGVALACNGTPSAASFCAAVLIAPPFLESSVHLYYSGGILNAVSELE